MGHSNGKAIRVPPANLVLICEVCGNPILSANGFLTIKGPKWLLYHDACAASANVVCGVLTSVSGNKPCKINVSLIATADLLLTSLATLAGELKATNWLQLVQKVVWDTEHYRDQYENKTTAKQMVADNQDAYDKAGITTYAGRLV